MTITTHFMCCMHFHGDFIYFLNKLKISADFDNCFRKVFFQFSIHLAKFFFPLPNLVQVLLLDHSCRKLSGLLQTPTLPLCHSTHTPDTTCCCAVVLSLRWVMRRWSQQWSWWYDKNEGNDVTAITHWQITFHTKSWLSVMLLQGTQT